MDDRQSVHTNAIRKPILLNAIFKKLTKVNSSYIEKYSGHSEHVIVLYQ